MPDQEVAFLTGKAVVWFKSGVDRYGQPQVANPVELNVRWEDGRAESLDRHGNVIPATVALVVDQDVPIGSAVWQGKLVDLPTTQVPPNALLEVIAFDKVPDTKARAYYREATLMRWKEILPQVVGG